MKLFAYISGWAEHGGAPGLGLHEVDTESGEIRLLKMLDESTSFNASCFDEERGVLYIDNECVTLPEHFVGGGGRVLAYKVDRANGDLTLMNAVPALCPNPAWPQLEPERQFLLLANHSGFNAVTKVVRKEDGSFGYEIVYDDATLNLYRLNEDGSIGAVADVIKHEAIVPGRPLHSHPHCIVPAPGKNLYAVADKGESNIRLYTVDYENEKLKPVGSPLQLPVGSAPRYIVFHPTLPYFYVNQERNMNMVCVRYDEDGTLELVKSVSVLPEGVTQPAGVLYEQQGFLIHPNGKFAYSILNGPDAIAVFSIGEDGLPSLEANVSVPGKWPRGAAFSPDGKLLIVSCLVSGDVVTYRIGKDGIPVATGYKSMQKGGSYITVLPEKKEV